MFTIPVILKIALGKIYCRFMKMLQPAIFKIKIVTISILPPAFSIFINFRLENSGKILKLNIVKYSVDANLIMFKNIS